MSEENTTALDPEVAPSRFVGMAYANITFTTLAILTLVVTIKTDNVRLFGIVALLSVIALATGFMRRCQNRLIEAITFLCMVMSALMTFFGIAFVVIFGMWDGNL